MDEWLMAVVSHSQRMMAKLQHDPRYKSVCRDLLNRMTYALDALYDGSEDF